MKGYPKKAFPKYPHPEWRNMNFVDALACNQLGFAVFDIPFWQFHYTLEAGSPKRTGIGLYCTKPLV
jgi:hypothetical protein